VVIPDLRPDPEPHPGSAPAAQARPLLWAPNRGRPPPLAYKSRRLACVVSIFPQTLTASRRRHLKTLGAAAAVDLRLRRLSFVVEQCRSFAWR
jgi:hypothetical protein